MGGPGDAPPEAPPEAADGADGGGGVPVEVEVEVDLDLGDLDLMHPEDDAFSFDDVDDHIQENLEDEIVKEALDKGLDLRVYSRQIEDDLIAVERDSVNDYLSEARNMALLHGQIKDCDAILQNMEQMLGLFQADLGNISGEIQNLQQQSMSMNVKLKNRKAVQGELNTYVEGLALSKQLVDLVCNSPVNEAFETALTELHTKLEFASKQPEAVVSAQDMLDDLTHLKIKAASKIREFMLSKIYLARKPMGNPQLQQDQLLRLRGCFDFLLRHHHEFATEVRDEYVDTLSKVHGTYFKTYLARLLKLQFDEVADKDDLLGAEDNAPRRGGFFSAKPSLKNRGTVFSIGARASILEELEDPIIVPHTAKGEGNKDQRFAYERLFRSLVYALLSTSAREFLFCSQFFGVKDTRAYELFRSVMGKSTGLLLKHIEAFVQSCYDAIALVLCARIISVYKGDLRKKNIPCLEPLFDQVQKIIWPRFKVILELNITSVRDTDPEKLGNIDTRPHFIVRRYAEYSGALSGLNEGMEVALLTASLQALGDEVSNFIFRLAAQFPARKEQLVFLINNYDMMLAVQSKLARGKEAEQGFESLLKARTLEFAEEELSPYFGALITFVKQTEPLVAMPDSKIPVKPAQIQTLIAGFSKDWKRAMDEIDADVMRSFTNFKNGTVVLQQVLAQLIEYYERFLVVLKTPHFKQSGGWTGLVDRHHVRVEVKKHRTTF